MTSNTIRRIVALLAVAFAVGACKGTQCAQQPENAEEKSMLIQYLEVVTPDVDKTCAALAEMHGVSFGEAVPEFGNARTAELKSGGQIGVRAPMRADEAPVVRPYVLVADIDKALELAQAAGAEIAMPAMELPGRGKFAIYIHGGIQHGLWQL